MTTAKDYASFLKQLQWNYFATCRTPYKIYTMTVRGWLTKLVNSSNKVKQAFFVSERDKGDYNNLHVHMLIGTNTDMSYQEVSCLLYTSPSPRDQRGSRMPSSA